MYIDSGADRSLPESEVRYLSSILNSTMSLNPAVDLVYLPHLVRDVPSLPPALRVSNHLPLDSKIMYLRTEIAAEDMSLRTLLLVI